MTEITCMQLGVQGVSVRKPDANIFVTAHIAASSLRPATPLGQEHMSTATSFFAKRIP